MLLCLFILNYILQRSFLLFTKLWSIQQSCNLKIKKNNSEKLQFGISYKVAYWFQMKTKHHFITETVKHEQKKTCSHYAKKSKKKNIPIHNVVSYVEMYFA